MHRNVSLFGETLIYTSIIKVKLSHHKDGTNIVEV